MVKIEELSILGDEKFKSEAYVAGLLAQGWQIAGVSNVHAHSIVIVFTR